MSARQSDETRPAKRSGTSSRTRSSERSSKSSSKSASTSKSTSRDSSRGASADQERPDRTRSGGGAKRGRPGPVRIARGAAEQLYELTGREPEGVTGMERTDEGWTVHVELLELRRVPATTDMLAVYEVQTDDGGELQSYRRLRRYVRGAADDE